MPRKYIGGFWEDGACAALALWPGARVTIYACCRARVVRAELNHANSIKQVTMSSAIKCKLEIGHI